MKKNSYTINTAELESLAISPEIPFLGDVATIKQIGEKLHITLNFFNRFLANDIEYLINSRYPGIAVEVTEKTEAKKVQPRATVKKNINNIIVISSDKSGTGVSSSTINLALAMAEGGAKVGILDANIHKANQTTMLGISDAPDIINGIKIVPHSAYGVELTSINHAEAITSSSVNDDTLIKVVNNTLWGSSFLADGSKEKAYLDYLFIDLPACDSNLHLPALQTVPITGAITITIPEKIELDDANRSIQMFENLQIDNLGIIENMSTHTNNTDQSEYITISHTSSENITNSIKIPLLGHIPLDTTLHRHVDNTNPIMIAEPNHSISKCFRVIAQHIAIAIAHKPTNISQPFGAISIENH
ncbi:MAG: P-loop NTPase [Gammaproteobacteria bacterium]|nr:P-loop NTPase [Gammaproteobacteria bacterium]